MAKKKKKKLSKWVLVRDGLFSTLLSLLVCYFLSLLFFNTSFFNPLSKAVKDFSFLDVYYSERLNKNENINPNIILINVEHKSRYEIAQVMEQVLDAKPKVIGFDVILKEFQKSKEDTLLAIYLRKERVVTSLVLSNDEIISNHPFFRFHKEPGFVNFTFDSENTVVREFESERQQFNTTYESFSKVIAQEYLSHKKWESNKLDEKLKEARVINYQGDLDHFLYFTIDDFMGLDDKSIIHDKIVLLGYLGSPTGNVFDVEDKHFTPLNHITSGKSIPDMNGLVIHANIIAMLITDKFMYKVSTFWIVVLTFLCSFLASIYFIWLTKRLKISYRTVRKTILFLFAVLLVWVTLLLFKNGVVLKSTPIIAVTFFSAGFIKFYKHLVRWVNTKMKFKSYLK
ncbi:CHASE2 domain-containing protein [Maribacter sp. Asnod2-G09]|uniref:CHASE2 domain-containing protein n=1 Tax=Maribacter sp. Asnod2-G09 TaxID=3160577 RepID=UPI00386CB24D